MSNCTDVIVHYRFYCLFFFFFFFVALMLLCKVLRCNRTFWQWCYYANLYVALMVLCIVSRTFSSGTDVIVPICVLH